MSRDPNQLRAITIAGVKGGSTKSTTAAALASSLFSYDLPNGEPLRAVWVWADLYGQSEMGEAVLSAVFGDAGVRQVRWMEDRAFYVCLREQLPELAQTLSEQGELGSYAFIFDTGAQQVADAAKFFIPRSDLVICPFNRSGAADGLGKLIDTLETIGQEHADKVRVMLSQVPRRDDLRSAFFNKMDIRDFLSAPMIRERLLDEVMPQSSAAVDVASLRQEVNAGVVRRCWEDTAALTAEVVREAGWTDLVRRERFPDSAMIRTRLREFAAMVSEEAE